MYVCMYVCTPLAQLNKAEQGDEESPMEREKEREKTKTKYTYLEIDKQIDKQIQLNSPVLGSDAIRPNQNILIQGALEQKVPGMLRTEGSKL